MRIFDTHAHLTDTSFDCDREEVVLKLSKAGVEYAVEACCKATDIDMIINFCMSHPNILPTAGIHPEEMNAGSFSELKLIENAAQNKRIYAIGEIGLDYHYEEMCPKEIQKDNFDAQLSIAEEYKLPVIIHDRDAHGDCMDILRAHKGNLKGIMHCFSGSLEMAKECIGIGLHLGFGGVITFKNAKKSRNVLANVPVSQIVFETDCPYMAPEPFRGEKNDPSLIPYIIAAASQIRNEDMDSLADSVFQNSLSLFGLK